MILRLKDENGFWKEVAALQGPKGDPGPQGPKGDSAGNAVLYTPQFLSEEEKAQVRENIGVDGITGGSGGPVSWDKVKNRPFEELSAGQEIKWDGEINNLPTVEYKLQVDSDSYMILNYCKVSDDIIDIEQGLKSKFTITTIEEENFLLENNFVMAKTSNGSFILVNRDDFFGPGVLVCGMDGDFIDFRDNLQNISYSIPEAGIWLLNVEQANSETKEKAYYTSSFIYPPKIKAIDSKYLPDGCAGREVGTKILWDGVPTNTYVQPGWVIEWDGSDTGVSCPLISNSNSEMAVPEGAAFYKVSEKLDSLVGLTFEINGGYIELNSDSILTYFDENNGQVIATFGHTDQPFVWNVEKPGRVMMYGNEAVFEEEGLYFLKTDDEYYVERIYNEAYNYMEDAKFYKISEPVDDTINGYIFSVSSEDEGEMNIFISDEEDFVIGQTVTGSSYAAPYIFNIKTDNEKIELTGEFDFSFNFEKAGLYLIDIDIMGVTFNFLAGRDYQIFKINEKFLPEKEEIKINVDSYVSEYSSNPISSSGVYKALGNRNSLIILDYVDQFSNQLVTSKGIYDAIKASKIEVKEQVIQNSDDAVSGKAVYNALGGREVLRFDTIPTINSNNLITSGNIYTALEKGNVPVTSDDNGKFMRVVDGAWAAVTVSNVEDGEF